MQTKTFAAIPERLKQEPRSKGAVVAVIAMVLMMSGAFIISEQVTKAVAHAVGVNLPVSVSSLLPFGKTVIPKAQPVKVISTPSLVPDPAIDPAPVAVIRHADTGTHTSARPHPAPSTKSSSSEPAPTPTPTTESPEPTPTTESPDPIPTTPVPIPSTEPPTPEPSLPA